MDSKLRIPLFPFFIAAWPVLNLYASGENLLLLPLSQFVIFLIAVLAACLVLLIGLSLFQIEPIRAGMLVSFLTTMFFSYGHVEFALYAQLLSSVRGVLLPVWFGLFALGVFAILKADNIPQAAANVACVIGIMLVCFPLVQGIQKTASSSRAANAPALESGRIDVGPLELSNDPPPDIYYIVLDEYARADRLQTLYSYDNSEFIEYLRDRGFYVADQSQANYAMTFVSLASSLNMTYVQGLSESPIGFAGFDRLIVDSTVHRTLKELGYSYVHINSGWGPTDRPLNADIEFQYRGVGYENFLSIIGRTTVLNVIYPNVLAQNHRAHILGSFEQIENAASMDGPTFVLAHMLVPHPPYIFAADGSAVPSHEVGRMMHNWWDESFDSAYVDQVIFTNRSVEELVDRLLADSDQPPIIIIQSDHGTKPDRTAHLEEAASERLPILNAYYLPDGGERLLYPSISPVNSFRVIFKEYFNANIELLADRSYYSTYGKPESFVEWSAPDSAAQ